MVARGPEGVKADMALPQRQVAQRPVKGGAGGLDRTFPRGHYGPMLIYKIFRSDEWAALRRDGHTKGAPIDVSDGYVHFSTAEQAPETAAKHFAGEEGLYLLALDADTLGPELQWEPSRGGALFPHLYRDLRMEDVAWAQPLPLEDGQHRFPAGFETEEQ